MDFQTAVKTCIAKYTDFTGRASRSEFWWFFLAQFGVLVVTGLIHQYVYFIAALALLLPALAVGARRLHDIGKSGWFLLLSIIPVINLVLLYFFVQPSQPESNTYGAPQSV
ncbi:Inner membrane protein YhaI [compost metagenome]